MNMSFFPAPMAFLKHADADDTDLDAYYGIDIQIIRAVAKHLHFQAHLVSPADRLGYGYKVVRKPIGARVAVVALQFVRLLGAFCRWTQTRSLVRWAICSPVGPTSSRIRSSSRITAAVSCDLPARCTWIGCALWCEPPKWYGFIFVEIYIFDEVVLLHIGIGFDKIMWRELLKD